MDEIIHCLGSSGHSMSFAIGISGLQVTLDDIDVVHLLVGQVSA